MYTTIIYDSFSLHLVAIADGQQVMLHDDMDIIYRKCTPPRNMTAKIIIIYRILLSADVII